jgi:hypothetical protein
MGLRDQRVALQWVARHIADFGGNPDMVPIDNWMSLHQFCIKDADMLDVRART